METFGLPERTLKTMREIFARYPQVEKVVVYGSRAVGNYKTGSDIDLSMYGKYTDSITYQDLLHISGELDDSDIPYLVDLSVFDDLDHANLCDHIERVGKVFYEKEVLMWELKPLGDICKVARGTTITKKETFEGNIPVIGGGRKPTYYHNKHNRDSGAITISGSGASAGFVNYWDKPIFASDCSTVKPLDDSQDSRFLYFYLLSKQQFIYENFRSGAAQPHVYANDIATLETPVIPLPIQKQIVEKLDAAFADIDKAINATQKNIKNAEALFDSSLIHFCSEISFTDLTHKLSDITEFIIDCEHKTAPTQDSGFPLIRTPNIKKGSLEIELAKRISQETYETWTRRGKPKPGDLIFAREAPAGNVGVIPDDSTVCLGQRTVLIRVENNNIISSEFLCYLLLHPTIQGRLLAKSTGATVQHVNMRDIRNLPLPQLPNDEKQREIVKSIVDVKKYTDELIQTLAKKSTFLGNLKSSILNQAFSGELTKDAA